MERYAPVAKDLASRDVVSRSMTLEIREGRFVILQGYMNIVGRGTNLCPLFSLVAIRSHLYILAVYLCRQAPLHLPTRIKLSHYFLANIC